MTRTADATLTHVVSPDGTMIAVFVSGQGRPLVVVPGTTSDHTTWRLVLPLLEPHVTVHAVDRRGRGESGDAPEYSLAKEWADVAAVVDAAAAAAGGPVDLLGHSYGGNIAYGAATPHDQRPEARPVRGVATAEHRASHDVARRLGSPGVSARRRPARGGAGGFYRDMVKMSDDEIIAIKSAPTWPARVAAAHTVPREIREFGAHAFDPVRRRGSESRCCCMVGADSPDDIKADPEVVAAALPDARIHVLSGQAHMAHLSDPKSFAEVVLSFLRE